MTVTQTQIAAAKAKGLTNVEALAAACNKYSFPFYLACTILEKETGGLNVYGHDRGGVFTGPGNKEVTEVNYKEFRKRINNGETSNGVGPFQITWKGFFPDMEGQGLKPWLPADNILYGIQILNRTWKTSKGSVYATAKAYNGGAAYGTSAVAMAKVWKVRVGTADLVPGATPPPAAPPVQAPAEEPPTVKHSKIWNADYVSWKGEGWVTVKDHEILTILDRESEPFWHGIHLTQGGLSTSVAASANTHAGLGAFDVRTKNNTREQVWQLASLFLRSGMVLFPRGYNLGTWNPFASSKHGHTVSRESYDSLHPSAQAQYREYINGGDGLVGSARYTGPSTRFERWKDSVYNPANQKVTLAPLLEAWTARQDKPLPKPSPDVTAVQRALNRAGAALYVDGDPGPVTKGTYAKHDPDGIPDQESLTKLGLEVNP